MSNKPDLLLLRLPAKDHGKSVWEINLADVTVPPKAVASYPNDVTLGDSNDPGKPYHLDLSELSNTMERWVKARRSSGAGGDSNAITSASPDSALAGAQAGPHDIVYPAVRTEGGQALLELRLIRNEAKYDDASGEIVSITPKETVVVDYAPTRQAMRALFRSGAILMFLQQTTFPIGVTCYLLNLLALDGVDPDSLG